MLTPPSLFTLFIHSPFWVRSRSLILTFCGCSIIIPLYCLRLLNQDVLQFHRPEPECRSEHITPSYSLHAQGGNIIIFGVSKVCYSSDFPRSMQFLNIQSDPYDFGGKNRRWLQLPSLFLGIRGFCFYENHVPYQKHSLNNIYNIIFIQSLRILYKNTFGVQICFAKRIFITTIINFLLRC